MRLADLPSGTRRAGIEPARVFGCRDWREEAFPVLYADVDGARWVAPFGTPWMMRMRGCAVARKAVERYGLRKMTVHEDAVRRVLSFDDNHVANADGVCDNLHHAETVDVSFSASDGGSGVGSVPATFVAYCWRRWGEEGTWLYSLSRIAYSVDGTVVAVAASDRWK